MFCSCVLLEIPANLLFHNRNHQIRACRFPYHLIRCKKNHRDAANWILVPSTLEAPWTEISHCTSSCADRSWMEQDAVDQTSNLKQDPLARSTWQCPPCSEDHDKDLWEQTSTLFVWGTANYCGKNSPASNLGMEHKSNLASGMRVPSLCRMLCRGKAMEMHSNGIFHQMPEPRRLWLLPTTSRFSTFLLS